MLSGAKHLDFKVFETLHFVQGDNWRDFSEVSFSNILNRRRFNNMKNNMIIVLILIIIPIIGFSQDKTTPVPEYGWKHGLVAGLTLTQVAFTDWAQGGENALSYTFSADGKSVDDEEVSNWSNNYKFAFGQTRLGGQTLRKTDDIIDVSSVYIYKVCTYINPYASVSLKTQFAKGYIYPRQDSSVQVSAFFDPAYLTQSAGIGYQPIKEIKTRLGVGLREVITNNFSLYYTDDPKTNDKIEKTTIDGGMESVTEVEWQMEDNVLFTSKLELFAPFKTIDEIIVRNNSSVTAKVGKYITAILNVQLINEKKVTPRTQVKETIALGLSYTIF
ncbi:MAG: hypothetical protein C0417_05645 [Chlorobiaceae bacterium]|nr:hypothetical protein [Chlorobiaceae bacterium]